MTYAFIARNPHLRQIGVAIASGSDDCVGGSLYMDAHAGIVSVQGKGGAGTGERARGLLREGLSGPEILAALQEEDAELEYRQVMIAPRAGDMAVFTGAHCLHWCGHAAGREWMAAGSMLARGDVLPAMRAAYMKDMHAHMHRRLIAALRAGAMAGGDLRGHRSAGVFVYGYRPFSHAVTEADGAVELLAGQG